MTSCRRAGASGLRRMTRTTLGERGAICERWLASTTRGGQSRRTRRRGSELTSSSTDPSGSRCRDAVEIDPVGDHGDATTPPPTTGSGAWRRSSTTAPDCRSTCTSDRSTRRSSAAARRTRRTTSRRASTWARTRSRSSGVHPLDRGGGEPRAAAAVPRAMGQRPDPAAFGRPICRSPTQGFHIPSGVLHAPGTALTIELQEDSDVFAMLQALNAGRIISKDLLWKDVRRRGSRGEGRAVHPRADRLGGERRSELLRAPPSLAAARRGSIAGRRRGVLDLLRHHEVQREEAPGRVPDAPYRSIDAGVHNVLGVVREPVRTAGCRSEAGILAGRAARHARPRRPRGRGAQHRSRRPARDQVLRTGRQPRRPRSIAAQRA